MIEEREMRRELKTEKRKRKKKGVGGFATFSHVKRGIMLR